MPNATHPQNTPLLVSILQVLGPEFDSVVGQPEGRHQGPRQKLLPWQLWVGLIAQQVQFQGCLSASFRTFLGVDLSDSALCQRRAQLGLEPFAAVVRHALRPLADPSQHPDCFFAGLRLLGLDGRTLSVRNTPAHAQRLKKARTRRGPAAFGKVGLGALVELGTHAPVGAAVSLDGESELALAAECLAQLPEQSLLLVDRLYGQGPFVDRLSATCAERGSHFLVRVRGKLRVEKRASLEDGSAWVAVRVCDPQRPRQVLRTVRVREVSARVFNRRTGQWSRVRLWTSLSPEPFRQAQGPEFIEGQASAEALVALYARRWEQEIFYKELKIQMRGSDLLRGQLPESAAQEVLACLVAGARLAGARLAGARLAAAAAAAAAGAQPGQAIAAAGAVRISFGACHTQMVALWTVLAAGRGLLDAATERALIERVRAQIARQALRPRRARSCGRKVRQPVKKWPRMLTPLSVTSPLTFELCQIA